MANLKRMTIPLTRILGVTNLFFSASLFPIPLLRVGGNLFFCILLLLVQGTLYPQSSERTFLVEEIQHIERALKNPELSGSARYTILIRQAKLFQLLGNLEGAAQSWTDAAFAEQGKRDDAALLEGAFCFLALGETEKAEASVRTVSLTGKESSLLCKARYLGAQIKAFHSGDISSLIELIPDPDYEGYRPAIYYTLWRISGSDMYKTRLISEYSLSPEGRIMKPPASGKGSVVASPTALWLLFPGLHTREVPGETSPSGSGDRPRALQTGLFGKEENAKAMAERLKNAGFEAIIHQRTINDGGLCWVVTVPLGTDIHRTIMQLKDKGFDSFPIF